MSCMQMENKTRRKGGGHYEWSMVAMTVLSVMSDMSGMSAIRFGRSKRPSTLIGATRTEYTVIPAC